MFLIACTGHTSKDDIRARDRLLFLNFKKFIKLKKRLINKNSTSFSLRDTITLLIYTYKRAQIHSPYINLMTIPLILNKEKYYLIKDPTQYLKINF